MIENCSKKVILYIGFFSLPDHDAAANRVLNNAKAMAMCGHRIIFVDEQVEYPYNSFPESHHLIEGFDVWSQKRPVTMGAFLSKMIFINNIKYIIEYYKKNNLAIDLVIAYNFPALALKKTQRFCLTKNIKVTADCTEWYSGKSYRFPLSVMSAVDSFYRMRIVQKKLDGIICISGLLKDYYKKMKVVFIPPLVDSYAPIWNQDVIRWDYKQLNLIYAGDPAKGKENLWPLIQSLANLQNREDKEAVVFRIVGITREKFFSLYPEAKGISERISQNIVFYGRLAHKETVRMIKSSDYLVFLRPNNRVTNAGFSTKFVEATTCNTAVITNNTGDLEEYIIKAGKGILLNTERDIGVLFSSSIAELKDKARFKEKEVSRLFDYRTYVATLDQWIASICG